MRSPTIRKAATAFAAVAVLVSGEPTTNQAHAQVGQCRVENINPARFAVPAQTHSPHFTVMPSIQGMSWTASNPQPPVVDVTFLINFSDPGELQAAVGRVRVPFLQDQNALIAGVNAVNSSVTLGTTMGTIVLQNGQVPTTNGQAWPGGARAAVFITPGQLNNSFMVTWASNQAHQMVVCGN